MTTTTLTPTRSRLRAVNAPPPTLPYTHRWLRTPDGLWTLVVRVTATRQQLRISYACDNAPEVVNAEAVAARLYGLRRWEGA